TTTTTTITTSTEIISSNTEIKDRKINYSPEYLKESDQDLENPYRGWFHGAVTVDLTDYPELDCNYIFTFHQVKSFKNGLQYLGVRLGEFNNRRISKKALASLDNLLSEYKKRKETIDPTTQLILRFYYDGENYCKTNSTSFQPIFPTQDNPTTTTTTATTTTTEIIEATTTSSVNSIDGESDFKLRQLDNGHLYVSNEEFEYFKQEYDPNILDDHDNDNMLLSRRSSGDKDYEIDVDEEEEIQEIGFFNDNDELQVIQLNEESNLFEEIQLSEEDQQKLESKEKYYDERYYNEYNELSLTKEELKDYLSNSIFINDKLNLEELVESNNLDKRYISDEYAFSNATEEDYNLSSIRAAKELRQISFPMCSKHSDTDKDVCIEEKLVNKQCIFQFKSSDYITGCVRYNTTEIEPENLNLILIHITQLSDIINKYSDLIYIYQGTFVGTYGEMHSSKYLDKNSLTQIIDTMDKTFDPSIFLSVRTPSHYRGIKDVFETQKGYNYTSYNNRMGLYNDGLFFRDHDYYTYKNIWVPDENGFVKEFRDKEVQFQDDICLRVPNGGEGVFLAEEDKYINIDESQIPAILENPEYYGNFYVSNQHARNIHLTYLNDDYDKKLIDHWGETEGKYIYTKDWNITGDKYIGNHLGYRYVLRSSEFFNNTLEIIIENVGYAPAYIDFESYVLLKSTSSSSHSIKIKVESDNKKWGFVKQENGYEKTVSLLIDLEKESSNFLSDNYEVYFRVYDPRTDTDIKFGNTNTYYTNYGYLIGTITME
ncbi:hypothetical protein PIROE2DRAFT_1147, partial [Piromyces sp. E2]